MSKHKWKMAAMLIAIAAAATAADSSSTLSVNYIADAWRNTKGGMAVGNRYLDRLDAALTTDELFGVPRLMLHADVMYNNGHAFNRELIGTKQGISNIETIPATRLFELWLDYGLTEDLSLRAGLYDLNSEFDAIETAKVFLNPSHGIAPEFSQSGKNGPSIFPVTSAAVRVSLDAKPWQFRIAALDAVSGDPEHPSATRVKWSHDEGLLLVGEIDYRLDNDMRFAVGHWRYTAQFDDLLATDSNGDPLVHQGHSGTYSVIESPRFFSQSESSGLRTYVRFGVANENIYEIHRYLGAGVVYRGAARAGDQLGLSVGIAQIGAPGRQVHETAGEVVASSEQIVELTYRTPLTDWFTLQADVQHVHNANMNVASDDALAIGLRIELAFSRSFGSK